VRFRRQASRAPIPPSNVHHCRRLGPSELCADRLVEPKTARIRALNDELRQRLIGGMAVMTPGIAALGQEAVARIVKNIEVYDDFGHANDPHEEHDSGAFDADGNRVFFKVDYFDSISRSTHPILQTRM
jgi:hypothetical protein